MELTHIIAVTCCSMVKDRLSYIEALARSGVSFIILREKELNGQEYAALAKDAISICRRHGKPLVLHTYTDAALALDHPYIHLPFSRLAKLDSDFLKQFKIVGVSVHSEAEARAAQEYGADYIVAGHIFATDCKKGLPPRGIHFIRSVSENINIPLYAIGGIKSEHELHAVLAAGASGACMMSGLINITQKSEKS